MNAVRIRKRLDEPIPQLPELTSLVGRTVEIIVLDESEALRPEEPSNVNPSAHFDDLLGGWPEDQREDGFDDVVRDLRRRPWTRSAGAMLGLQLARSATECRS